MTPVRRADGHAVTTIEGLSPDRSHPLQLAWLDLRVPQCGYCQAGQLMTAAALLVAKPKPTDDEISVVADRQRKLRIDEAWIAMDAGTIVNPDRVRAQLEGSVIMGISNALFGGITMKAGATEQSNFRDARIARIGDVPRKIHVDIVPSDGPPCGVGEPGVPPVAPALANAAFALTGQRIREIPLARALGI